MSAARQVHGAGGQPHALGPELARGGEAVVHPLLGRPGELAKLYQVARPEMREKLEHMRAHPPDDPARAHGHASIAWPRELLFDARGAFVGYTMTRIVDAAPILDVFNPRRRAQLLPGFDRRYLLRTARNLASALSALHEAGYVVGDLNERNVLVTERTLVTLIDTDSFQVQRQKDGQIVVYPCPVGRAEYTPPELQGQTFRGLLRRPEHDGFGLAVLIFQLLMAGNHPFRGRWRGSGEPPSLEAKIAAGQFPWAAGPGADLAPPPGAPGLDQLDPDLAELFLACFADGHDRPAQRPSAEAWSEALEEAEARLAVCGQGHAFGGHLRRCPDCGGRAERRGRRDVGGAHPAAALGRELVSATAGGLSLGRAAVGGLIDWSGRRSSAADDPTAGGDARAELGQRAQRERVTDPTRLARVGATLRLISLGALTATLVATAGSVWVAVAARLPTLAPLAGADGSLSSGAEALLFAGLALFAGNLVGDAEFGPGALLDRGRLRGVGLAASVSLAAWLLGWFTPAFVLALIRGGPLGAWLFGRAGDAAGGPSWTAGWVMYGGLMGLLGARDLRHGAGLFWTGFLSGGAGWLALQVLMAALFFAFSILDPGFGP